MNRLRACIVFFAFTVAVAARAEETNTPAPARATSNAAPSGVTSNALPASITIDGTTYEEVRWQRVTPTTVTIFHKTGVATIPLDKLPPELQKRFGYDPDKAASYNAAQQQAAAQQARQAAISQYSKIPFKEPLAVGAMGIFESGNITQVISPTEMLANVPVTYMVEPGATSYDGQTIVKTGGYQSLRYTPVLIRGLSTQGLVDNSALPLNHVYRCTGTWTYNDTLGAPVTVYVVEPIR